MTVVGVTAMAHGDPLQHTREYFPVLYRPLAQHPEASLTLSLRSASDPRLAAPALRAAVRDLDRTLPLESVRSIDEIWYEWLWPVRFNATIMSGLGAFALVLAALGVYGMVTYMVTQRTREIGVRVALGAQRRDVLGAIMRSAVVLALAGVAAGVAASLALTQVLSSMLYGASTDDPLVLTAVGTILVGVALLASYLPARRATRVDPLVALRSE
jgi:putative ABC transport system permease protein